MGFIIQPGPQRAEMGKWFLANPNFFHRGAQKAVFGP